MSAENQNKKLKPLYSEKSSGTHGWFELEINVDSTDLPNLQGRDMDREIWKATYEAAKNIKAAIMRVVIRNNKEAQAAAAEERTSILALFPEPIYVEEIPNGYCSDYCCKHLPWFVVTTKVGRIKIGWRKRVMAIDWSDTRGTGTSDYLFKDEDVTKDDKGIHAWDLERAKFYIDKIINTPAPEKKENE